MSLLWFYSAMPRVLQNYTWRIILWESEELLIPCYGEELHLEYIDRRTVVGFAIDYEHRIVRCGVE